MVAQSVSEDEFEALEAAVRRAVTSALRPSMRSYAHDIAQAAMERLLVKMRENPTARPRTQGYVWRMANYAVIDEVRRLQRRREDSAQEDPMAVDDRAAPDDALHRKRVSAAITDCVQRLPDDRRRAVTLYLQGHGISEAAQIMAWVRKRAENAVYRGLAAVRRCLEGKGVTP
jgi:RNA polymerase sigma-70 factor (ECF subfamily)